MNSDEIKMILDARQLTDLCIKDFYKLYSVIDDEDSKKVLDSFYSKTKSCNELLTGIVIGRMADISDGAHSTCVTRPVIRRENR